MNANEALEAYTEKFGGFPYFLFMGATDEQIVKAVEMALKTGKEIVAKEPDADY